jgi:hypothetical protein
MTFLLALSLLVAPKLSGTVVVVNQRADTVTLVDLASMTAYKHVAVVGGPHEAAVSPNGKRVVVTNYHSQTKGPQKSLSLISLPSGEVLKTIDLGRCYAHRVHFGGEPGTTARKRRERCCGARLCDEGPGLTHAGLVHRPQATVLLEHGRRERLGVRLCFR